MHQMMKFVLFMIIVGAAVAMMPPNEDHDALWSLFKKKFQKKYQPSEEQRRRLIWDCNVKTISRHNLEADVGMHSYKTGLSEYSDLTKEEFNMKLTGGYMAAKANSATSLFFPAKDADIPKKLDWRDQGFVTPVKNQKHCRASWAFSATGSLEGQHMKKTGKLVSLSEQNLIDCSEDFQNAGCAGGNVQGAFSTISRSNGIDTEESYPYTGENGTCKFKKSNVGATCSGFELLPSDDEEILQNAVAMTGPISVVIDAHSPNFYHYSHGIYDDPACSSTQVNHCALVVGYGTSDDGVDFWILKNSWGPTWGENGYFKMVRNKNNQCGIATDSTIPTISSPNSGLAPF